MHLGTCTLIFGLSWWSLGFVLFFLAIVVCIYFFSPEILKQVFEVLRGIPHIFAAFFQELGKLVFRLAGVVWSIWCLVFALRWLVQYALRYVFVTTAWGILTVSSIYAVVELGFVLINGLKFELPKLYSILVVQISSRAPSLYAWLVRLHVPRIHEIPFKAEAALWVLALLMASHHLREFRASRRRESVPAALEELFLEFDTFRKNSQPDRAAKDAFLETLMRKMKDILDEGTKRDVAFSLWEEEETLDAQKQRTKTGVLQITFLPKNSPLDKTFRLAVGEGGAGKAFKEKVAVYIPSILHGTGIDLNNEVSIGVTYKKGDDEKYFRSILCVPVLVNSRKDAIAVIAVSSLKSKAFWDADFEIVRLAAAIASTLY
jgi:hypothetical protein